jgi:DNA-binding response OmpR family regulator
VEEAINTSPLVDYQARILVVQNDPVLLGLVSGSLRPEGHIIIEARSPTEALRIPPHEFQTIDLVITEINCKPISGIELIRRLARKGINVPVLFVAASHTLANVLANSFGRSSVIEEPFTGAELRASVTRCLAAYADKQPMDGAVSPAL